MCESTSLTLHEHMLRGFHVFLNGVFKYRIEQWNKRKWDLPSTLIKWINGIVFFSLFENKVYLNEEKISESFWHRMIIPKINPICDLPLHRVFFTCFIAFKYKAVICLLDSPLFLPSHVSRPKRLIIQGFKLHVCCAVPSYETVTRLLQVWNTK